MNTVDQINHNPTDDNSRFWKEVENNNFKMF